MEEEAKACVPENACLSDNAGSLAEMAKDDRAWARLQREQEKLFLRNTSRVVAELSFERKELCEAIRNLTKAIKANPEEVSSEQKALWFEQHCAMLAYKHALDKRIINLINESENDYAIDLEPKKS